MSLLWAIIRRRAQMWANLRNCRKFRRRAHDAIAGVRALSARNQLARGRASCGRFERRHFGKRLDVRIRKTTKDPLADARRPSAGSRRSPRTTRSRCNRQLLAELSHLSERDARRTPVSPRGGVSRRCADKGLAQGAHHAIRRACEPLVAKIESQLWQALFDLTQGFLIVLCGVRARDVHPCAEQQVAGAAARASGARRSCTSASTPRSGSIRYEQWIPAKWAELHALFTLACSRQIERAPLVVDAAGGTTTIEHEYLVALVLQLVNAGNMTPQHLEWVTAELDEWCQPLRLTLEPSSVTSFYVDLGGRAGLRRRAPVAARRARAVPRHATAARAADAERRGARAEDQGSAAVGKDRAAQRAARRW